MADKFWVVSEHNASWGPYDTVDEAVKTLQDRLSRDSKKTSFTKMWVVKAIRALEIEVKIAAVPLQDFDFSDHTTTLPKSQLKDSHEDSFFVGDSLRHDVLGKDLEF